MASSGEFIQRLQSVRALAALAVAGEHTIECFHFVGRSDRVARGIDNIFYGTGGVIVFFVLSGFVLGFTLAKETEYDWHSCRGFLVRRFLRLYPALFVSLIVYQVFFLYFFFPQTASVLGSWIHKPPLSGVIFLKNIALLDVSLNQVNWSLQTEALFSLFLPFVYFLVGRRGWLNFLGFGVLILVYRFLGWDAFGLDRWSAPWSYLYICYAGWLLALFRKEISAIYRKLPRLMLYALIATALAICLSTPHFGGHLVYFTIGAIFLVGAIAYHVAPRAFSLLDSRLLIYLGNISYSFYLLHPLCLICVVEWALRCLGEPFVSAHLGWVVPVLGLVSVILAIPAAWLSYYLCERPFSSRKPGIPHSIKDLKPVPIRIEIKGQN